MTILDDEEKIKQIDLQGMYSQLESLPDQLLQAWTMGRGWSLEPMEVDRILIAGMGGSAIGADLVSGFVAPACPVPIVVHRDYDLPAWAKGKRTLVVLSSHSGNTEETLSSYERGRSNGCSMVVITTGGKLADLGAKDGIPVWKFVHDGQPRSAVGFSFGILVALLFQLGFVPDLSDEVTACVDLMKREQTSFRMEVPQSMNPAKNLASELAGKLVHVIGSDHLAPVARRWKGQVNELAKTVAVFEGLPEMDHNTMAGVVHPDVVRANTFMVFLKATSIHSRNQVRMDLTQQGFSREGFTTCTVEAAGSTRLQQLWTSISLGDYVSYYLAMTYGEDPTPIEAISRLKKAMSSAK
jgi:glucose/mannose-6-phosphate isomerase